MSVVAPAHPNIAPYYPYDCPCPHQIVFEPGFLGLFFYITEENYVQKFTSV